MRGPAEFFDIDERLKEISAKGGVPTRSRKSGASLGRQQGRPPSLRPRLYVQGSDPAGEPLAVVRATEFLIKNPLSFMRFLGLGLFDPAPDANTIWTFREALTRATIGELPAIMVLFRTYERH